MIGNEVGELFKRPKSADRGDRSAAMTDPPPEVQDYIDALDAPHRRLFDHLQDLILDELPDAEVVFAYQIPMYKSGRAASA